MTADLAGQPRDQDRKWSFIFRSNSLALNFVASVAGGTLRPNGVERLTSPVQLAEWIDKAGFHIRADALTEKSLHQARHLREGIFRLVDARVGGRAVDPSDIGIVNDAAKRLSTPTLLDADGASPLLPQSGGFENVLSAIARDAIAVLTDKQSHRLKKCASPYCPVYFIDRSRAGNRRWCSMNPCGHKANARAYRKRKKISAAD